jgi:hypothetical protein
LKVFEPSKRDMVQFSDMKVRIGGYFTQAYQYLTHSNTPTYIAISTSNPLNKNFLYNVIRAEYTTSAHLSGFNLAMANLNIDIQLADGIRVAIENYMSSRHHSEFWVKSGCIQID